MDNIILLARFAVLLLVVIASAAQVVYPMQGGQSWNTNGMQKTAGNNVARTVWNVPRNGGVMGRMFTPAVPQQRQSGTRNGFTRITTYKTMGPKLESANRRGGGQSRYQRSGAMAGTVGHTGHDGQVVHKRMDTGGNSVPRVTHIYEKGPPAETVQHTAGTENVVYVHHCAPAQATEMHYYQTPQPTAQHHTVQTQQPTVVYHTVASQSPTVAHRTLETQPAGGVVQHRTTAQEVHYHTVHHTPSRVATPESTVIPRSTEIKPNQHSRTLGQEEIHEHHMSHRGTSDTGHYVSHEPARRDTVYTSNSVTGGQRRVKNQDAGRVHSHTNLENSATPPESTVHNTYRNDGPVGENDSEYYNHGVSGNIEKHARGHTVHETTATSSSHTSHMADGKPVSQQGEMGYGTGKAFHGVTETGLRGEINGRGPRGYVADHYGNAWKRAPANGNKGGTHGGSYMGNSAGHNGNDDMYSGHGRTAASDKDIQYMTNGQPVLRQGNIGYGAGEAFHESLATRRQGEMKRRDHGAGLIGGSTSAGQSRRGATHQYDDEDHTTSDHEADHYSAESHHKNDFRNKAADDGSGNNGRGEAIGREGGGKMIMRQGESWQSSRGGTRTGRDRGNASNERMSSSIGNYRFSHEHNDRLRGSSSDSFEGTSSGRGQRTSRGRSSSGRMTGIGGGSNERMSSNTGSSGFSHEHNDILRGRSRGILGNTLRNVFDRPSRNSPSNE